MLARAPQKLMGQTVLRLDEAIEEDADAVALATIHASKGLQYPVVPLPFVADRFVMPSNRLTSLHLHDEQGRRRVDIGVKDDNDRGERLRRHLEEEDG